MHELPTSTHLTAFMQTTANTSSSLSDIRTWSISDRRAKLAKGTRIKVFDHKGRNVIDIPLPLLEACSSKMVARVDNNKITFPSSIDGPTATKLLNHLLDLTTSHSAVRMTMSFDHIENLKLCTVAEVLGLPLYVQHVLKYYTDMARSNEMPYSVIDFVTKMKGDFGKTLFNEVAQTQGITSFQGRIPDPKAFTAYLTTNACLQDAITAVHVEQQKLLEEKNKAHEDYMVREACRQSKRLMTQEEKEDAEQKKENWKQTQIRLKEKERKETELVAVVREKRKKGYKKWSAEEAAILDRYFGVQVPVCT